MIKGCIFDFDGTLADTITTIAWYANRAIARQGFAPIETDRYRYLVGDGADTLIRRVLALCGDTSEELFQTVYHDYRTAYQQDILYKTEIYPGIPALLDMLEQAGIRLAVLSNKSDDTVQMLVETLFPGRFAVCYGARPSVPLKPHPDAALEVAAAMGLTPAECFYIGDTKVDIQTGHAAGMQTVGVLWGFRDRAELLAHRADFIVEKPIDIATIIKEMSA